VAVVTGGASGIGFALSRQFAKRGLDIVLVDVEADPLAKAQDELEQTGATVLAVPTDVSDGEQVASLAAQVQGRFGRVDVLCNNAGVVHAPRPFWEFDERDWRWLLGVNVWGVIHGLRHFLPTFIRQGSGYILNTASTGGLEMMPFNAPYAVSKHAVVVLSESLRFELATMAPGVGISVLCPGPTATRLLESERNRPSDLVPTASAPTHDEAFADEMSSVMTSVWIPDYANERVGPDEVAATALAGIEDGSFFISPQDAIKCIHHRADVLAALPPSP
jgi:NAD(P)-dependent dehydrogenase (short-subunit alcohol dehydrogenase family)